MCANDGQKITAGITLDSADVSEGGAFLRSDLLFEIGETLHLEIPLPDGPTIKTRGRVVRVRRAGTGGMGIEFLGLSSQDRKALTAGLTKLASSKTNRLS